MKFWKVVLAGASLTLGAASVGCTVDATGEWQIEEDTVDQKEQEENFYYGGPARIKHVFAADNDGEVSARCPSGYPHALGGAHESSDSGLRVARPHKSGGESVGMMTRGVKPNEGRVAAQAICSNAEPQLIMREDDDGNSTVHCPTNYVAVGGGGHCYGSGELTRSRPYPDDDESTPTGWRATCTTGRVVSYVNCVHEVSPLDFRECRTERKSDDDGQVSVSCDAGYKIVAAGAYCKDNGIAYTDFHSDLEGANIGCDGNTINGYAVCCEGLIVD